VVGAGEDRDWDEEQTEDRGGKSEREFSGTDYVQHLPTSDVDNFYSPHSASIAVRKMKLEMWANA